MWTSPGPCWSGSLWRQPSLPVGLPVSQASSQSRSASWARPSCSPMSNVSWTDPRYSWHEQRYQGATAAAATLALTLAMSESRRRSGVFAHPRGLGRDRYEFVPRADAPLSPMPRPHGSRSARLSRLRVGRGLSPTADAAAARCLSWRSNRQRPEASDAIALEELADASQVMRQLMDRRCRECDASAGAQRHSVLDNSATAPEHAWSRTRDRPISSRLVSSPIGNVSYTTDANAATIRCCLAPRHSTPHGRHPGHASANAWPMDSAAASAPIPPSRFSPHSQSIRAPLQSAGFRTSPELLHAGGRLELVPL